MLEAGVALLGEDTDGIEPTSVLVFCPECAREEFGYRADRPEGNDDCRLNP